MSPRPSRVRRAAALALLVAAMPPAPAAGQSGAAPRDTASPGARPRTDPFCWRGRPLPRCRAFMLFELGYHARVVGTGRLGERPAGTPDVGTGAPGIEPVGSHLSWSVGAMHNRDSVTAVGGALVVGGGDRGPVVGAQVRYRRWTGRASSAELGAGPLVMQVPRVMLPPGGAPSIYDERLRLGVGVDARLNYADRVAGGARLVLVPSDNRLHGALLAGANVGSGLAVAGTVGIGALVALAIYTLARAYS